MVPLTYGQPVDIGPMVAEDGVDGLVDVGFGEVLVGLVDNEIEFGVYDQELGHVDGQEPDHTDGDRLIWELIEEWLVKITDEDTLLGLTGSMLLVELTRTVVVVAPDAVVVAVSVSTPLPMTPCLTVCLG